MWSFSPEFEMNNWNAIKDNSISSDFAGVGMFNDAFHIGRFRKMSLDTKNRPQVKGGGQQWTTIHQNPLTSLLRLQGSTQLTRASCTKGSRTK